MPYGTRKSGKMTQVFNKESGKVYGTHSSKEKANKQLAALHANTNESMSLKEFFQIDETAASDLAMQAKTATVTTPNKLMQQNQQADKMAQQTLKGVSQMAGTKIKQGKTDPQHPISNTFVQKPDGSTDVIDNATGQLKPVPGIGQGTTTQPTKTAGVV